MEETYVTKHVYYIILNTTAEDNVSTSSKVSFLPYLIKTVILSEFN